MEGLGGGREGLVGAAVRLSDLLSLGLREARAAALRAEDAVEGVRVLLARVEDVVVVDSSRNVVVVDS